MDAVATMCDEVFLSKVSATISRYNMFPLRSRVLVAVSGGADSLALLHVLYCLRNKYALSLWVAHLNHQIRGQTADDDQAYVGKVASGLNLEYISGSVDVRGLARRHGGGLEQAARKARYQFLEKTAERLSLTRIAVGHTASDQAETVLMRLIRGSGVEGLAGIPPVRGVIVRPLIEVYRQDTVEYCRSKYLAPRLDESNQDSRFLRNRLRSDLVPHLGKAYNPRIVSALCRTAELARTDNTFLEVVARKAFSDVLEKSSQDAIWLNARLFILLPQAIGRRVIRQALRRLKGDLEGIEAAHVRIISRLDAATGTKSFQLPGGYELRREYGSIVVAVARPRIAVTATAIEVPGKVHLPELGFVVRTDFVEQSPGEFSLDPNVEIFDMGNFDGPLEIRSRQPGDRFFPLGMRKAKRLKEFFIDEKIPRNMRDMIPLLVCGGRIMWVVGYRIDNRFKVTPAATRILRVEVERYAASCRSDEKDE